MGDVRGGRMKQARWPWDQISIEAAPVVVALAGLAAGLSALLAGQPDWAHWAFVAGTLPVLAALLHEIVVSLRRGAIGLDLVAALSMSAAVLFGEALAGNVVALMYAGGTLLESFAQGRARREMAALLGRVARTAMRHVEGKLVEVPIETLAQGDRILIRQGEVVPLDGRLDGGEAVLDQSALTGEALPMRLRSGAEVPSGSTNLGEAFDLVAIRPAAESTYAAIVKLVEAAQHSKAPSVRMGDRIAVWFLAVTVVMAGIAWWLSGDRLRALAVLVVATPCPLILALPVAIISGISRAARHGVLIKTGGALERMAAVRTAILDKTGTLTHGRAEVSEIRTAPGWDEAELLRLAASLDQASNHVIAQALVTAARDRGLVLSPPREVRESVGSGLSGMVEGRAVVVGGGRFVHEASQHGDPYDFRDGLAEGTVTVAVGVEGRVIGIIVLSDPVRDDAAQVLKAFRAAGISRIVLASGDRADVVAQVAGPLGLDAALGDLDPAAKLRLVEAERLRAKVMMVGDGVNDAPALAIADVGVAMGARGSAASSETADVVVLVDELGRLAQALDVARRARWIALQSVLGGLGLSLVAMAVAAFGYLPPVAGALTQELIDLAVILNALRVLR